MNTLALVWFVISTALADKPQLRAVAMNNRTIPGEAVVLEVVSTVPKRSVSQASPSISTPQGAVGDVLEIGPGHWQARLEGLPESDTQAIVEWNGMSAFVPIPKAQMPKQALSAQPLIEGKVGSTVHFLVEPLFKEELAAKDLALWSQEGEIHAENDNDGATKVVFKPSQSPFPRSVPIIIQSKKSLRSKPLLVIARLSATPTIPVKTEPGAEVSLTVGKNRYGPEVADENGRVVFDVSIAPGVDRAIAELKDKLGNKQNSTILLGGTTGPAVTLAHSGSVIEGGVAPTIFVAAAHQSGKPFLPTPSCDWIDSGRLHSIGDGIWIAQLPSNAIIGTQITCRAGEGTPASISVPIDRQRATRLVLHAYPRELSTDIPVAELQAYLLNGKGERLPAEGIVLEAEIGRVLPDTNTGETFTRARYDGSSAVSMGEDVLRATWKRPQGQGGVWNMAVRSASPKGSQAALIDVRTIDQGGRPLANTPVTFRFGSQQVDSATGPDGWTTHTFSWRGDESTAVVEVQSSGLVRRTIVRRNTRPLPAAGSPDLVTENLIPIRPGRIHSVILNLSPRVLTNDGMVGTLSVHLEDRAGNRVVGQNVSIAASQGTVGPVTARQDGTYNAQYAPPIGMPPGRVRVTASTDDGNFSAATDIEVVPRVVKWTIGAGGGLLVGNNRLRTSTFDVLFERRLPVPTLYIRTNASTYQLNIQQTDSVTNLKTEMHTTIFPIGLGVAIHRGKVRLPLSFGAQLLLAPYTVSTRFNDVDASAGMGWMLPGAGFHLGTGWRMARGELYTEARYMLLTAPGETLGWTGPMGGILGSIGYKFFY